MKSPEESKLFIIYQKIDQLRPYPNNARTHSKRQLQQIKASMSEFGFTNPVLVDRNNMIVAGHCRVEAAKRLGIADVPTIRLDQLTKEQIRATMYSSASMDATAPMSGNTLAFIHFQSYPKKAICSHCIRR